MRGRQQHDHGGDFSLLLHLSHLPIRIPWLPCQIPYGIREDRIGSEIQSLITEWAPAVRRRKSFKKRGKKELLKGCIRPTLCVITLLQLLS